MSRPARARFAAGLKTWLIACVIGSAVSVHGQAFRIQDDFTRGAASQDWLALDGACLTAGNGTGSIPACATLPYYGGSLQVGGYSGAPPDPVGLGALMLTDNSTRRRGAIISRFTFPSNQGLALSFSSVAFGGTGADGMNLFLMDGSVEPNLGPSGGMLGYSCSNLYPPHDGMVGGYIGLGLDEYGNYLNRDETTASGSELAIPWLLSSGIIGIRGAGSIAWRSLTARFPALYPSSLPDEARMESVKRTCQSGTLWNFAGWPDRIEDTLTPVADYKVLPGSVFVAPESMPLGQRRGTSRNGARPLNFKLRLTQDGLLSLSYSFNGGYFQPVLTDQSIIAANGPLPERFRFGFAASTGDLTHIHQVMCFAAASNSATASSAGNNTLLSGQTRTASKVYLAYHHPENWWGQLTSRQLLQDPQTGNVSIAAQANWDASCTLTGGNCSATGESALPAHAPDRRTIITWDGTRGMALRWSELDETRRSWLSANGRSGTEVLNFLRGERAAELTSSGTGSRRRRSSVLGDIIDSGPLWVGQPAFAFQGPWRDQLYPGQAAPEPAGSYAAFAASLRSRQHVVYVGANDGFLHGFRAGAIAADGVSMQSDGKPDDGLEVLAYMPSGLLASMVAATASSATDYTSPRYVHNFGVNAPASSSDLYYAGAWHTWLTGGLGVGGRTVYALDITDPARFTESNAQNLVIGEWSDTTIQCINVTGCGSHLGFSHGAPQIRRLHNGQWAVLFGNGLDSASGRAGLFVVTLDASTGAQRTYFLDTGRSMTGNGIAHVTPADLDGDHITDYVYAADLRGNVWRFDLTAQNPDQWAVSRYGYSVPTPLFSMTIPRPVTTKVQVVLAPTTDGPMRVLIAYGTGRKTPQSLSAPETYLTNANSLYGLWDWDMTAWNALSGSQRKLQSLVAPQAPGTGALQTQAVQTLDAGNGVRYRTATVNPVCWRGSSSCASQNLHLGWSLILPDLYEQVVYNPTVLQGVFIVNTIVPANNSPHSCTSALNDGWTMAVSIATGGAPGASFFADNTGGFVNYQGRPVVGVRAGAVGSPSVVTVSGRPHVISQTGDGLGSIRRINPPASGKGRRVTWQQIR